VDIALAKRDTLSEVSFVPRALFPLSNKTVFQLALNKPINNCHSSLCAEISNLPSISCLKAYTKRALDAIKRQEFLISFSCP
jgi:hypothetical protein